jgi:FixJ family two-component response regulator
LRRREVSLEAYESEIDKLAATQNAEKGLEGKLVTVEERKLILDALTEVYSKLLERDRQIFSLWMSGCRPREIAASTGASMQTIYRRLKQIQKQLVETHRKALKVADE